ncbi:unnamed protein product [Closterium sp. NIES-64]|nr:unnamed protein product [Closterium sp. NIES-64]
MEIQSPCMETTVACGGDVEGDGEEAAGDAPVDSLGQDPSRLSAGGLCVDDAPPGQVAGGPVATHAVTNAVAQTPTNTSVAKRQKTARDGLGQGDVGHEQAVTVENSPPVPTSGADGPPYGCHTTVGATTAERASSVDAATVAQPSGASIPEQVINFQLAGVQQLWEFDPHPTHGVPVSAEAEYVWLTTDTMMDGEPECAPGGGGADEKEQEELHASSMDTIEPANADDNLRWTERGSAKGSVVSPARA